MKNITLIFSVIIVLTCVFAEPSFGKYFENKFGVLECSLKGSSGNSMNGAMVVIESESLRKFYYTDHKGQVNIKLPEGKFFVSAYDDDTGWRDIRRKEINISENKLTRIDFVLDEFTPGNVINVGSSDFEWVDTPAKYDTFIQNESTRDRKDFLIDYETKVKTNNIIKYKSSKYVLFVRGNNVYLYADNLEFDPNTYSLFASGHVVIHFINYNSGKPYDFITVYYDQISLDFSKDDPFYYLFE